jgi:hypothetical protein
MLQQARYPANWQEITCLAKWRLGSGVLPA